MRDAFTLFDVDGDGSITATELRDVMKSLGRFLTERQVRDVVTLKVEWEN